MQLQIYSRYYPPPQVGERNDEPSLTQQHFQEECDINNILAKFLKTGILDTIGPGTYADLGNSLDYMQAMETIMNADEMFRDLPSNIRKEFDNDPAKYLAFVHDEKNLERGIELGIFNPKLELEPHLAQPKTPPKSE